MADPSIANIGYDDASDVTHSTAYVVLNTLVDEGQISEERAELLKQKFKDLHTRVLTVYKRDNLLLKRARQLSSELDGGRQRVFAKDEIARKDDAEIHRLKRELVDKQKELTAAQQRESILQVEALEYDRKKQNFILEREDAMAAEEARIRPKMEALQKEITELGKQVKDSIGKYDELKKQHEKLAKEEEACKAESENFGPALANAKQLYMNVEHDPERADKQLKLVMRTLTAARRDQTNIEERLKSQADTIIRLEQQRNNRVNDHAAAKANLQSIRNDIDAKRRTLATLNTSLEAELESRQSYQERMLELDHLINAARIAAREETDGIERIQREKAKQSRQFSTLEQSREDVRHEKQSVKEHIRSIQRELDQIVVKRKNLKKSIEASKADIEARTKRLLREKRKEKVFTDQANLVLEDITSVEDLMREKSQREEVKRRELVAIMSRRQEMSRESAREESRVALAKNELQMKEIELRECSRRKEEMTRRLNGVIATFQAVKRERLQRAAQIQALTQKMTEVAEKTKILENELEVLLRESALKEKELLKKKRLTTEGTQSCTNLRLEKNKQRKRLEKVADAEKDIKAQVRRLNTDIGTVEDMMSALQSSYEKAVESRNQTGIQLIDRNDELGLLVTKVKVQEQAIDEGIVLTNAKADEIQALKVRLADIQRELDVCHRSVPKVKQMEEELAELQEALDDERWRTEVLDNDLTDPSNPYRWRRIPQMNVNAAAVPKVTPPTGGAAVEATMAAERRTPAAIEVEASNGIPSVTERPASEAKDGVAVVASTAPKDVSDEFVRLQARCQELEQRLNGINEKLREKDLILAEVTELSERIGGQAESGREFTLALAKQVNQYQSGIRVKTRQMMATLSELSLFQASSNQLHQEVQRLEEVVEEAERRLQEGEVPFAEAEEEYQRAKVANQRYNELLTRRRDEKDFEEMKAKSVKTAAEPRPNAYIPDDDLGLPKPYGPFLPFKSSAAIKVPPPPEKAAASTPRGAAPSTSRRGPASSKRAPQPRPVQSHYRGDLDALRHSLDMETLRSSASFTRPGMERDPDQVRLSQRDGTFAHTH